MSSVLDNQRAAALDAIRVDLDRRINAGVTIAVTGGSAVVACDERSLLRWLALDTRRDLLTALGGYPVPTDAADGTPVTLADAAAVHTAVDTIFLSLMALEGQATAARAAVADADTQAEVTAALAAYLGI
jgi:hypothetical protein